MGRARHTKPTKTVALDRDELLNALDRKLRWLRTSAAAFDAGDQDEAERMAGELRALLHDGASPGLLQTLGVRRHLWFTDSESKAAANVVMMVGGLVGLKVEDLGKPGRIAAVLDDRNGRENNPARFAQWWSGNRPIWTTGGLRYNRRFVVLAMANHQDAHVDPRLDADYHAMMRDQLGLKISALNGVQFEPRPIGGDVARGSVRQITWELLDTIDRSPDLFARSKAA